MNDRYHLQGRLLKNRLELLIRACPCFKISKLTIGLFLNWDLISLNKSNSIIQSVFAKNDRYFFFLKMIWRIKLLSFLVLAWKNSNLPSPNIRLCPISHFYLTECLLKLSCRSYFPWKHATCNLSSWQVRLVLLLLILFSFQIYCRNGVTVFTWNVNIVARVDFAINFKDFLKENLYSCAPRW